MLEVKETLDTRIEEKLNELESRMVRGFEAMDRKLELIADAVGVKNAVSAGNDDEDRKRLKERLSEALEIRKHRSLVSEINVEGWMEYFFGICKPNGRFGKQGSRCFDSCNSCCDELPEPAPHHQVSDVLSVTDCRLVHPQSRFIEGASINCAPSFLVTASPFTSAPEPSQACL